MSIWIRVTCSCTAYSSITPIAWTFSRPHLADYPWRRNMDGFLRLTHGFCLERSSPEQAGPTGSCVYTASQARLGGPIFTPGAFQRKPPAEAPRLRYTTQKTIHTASCSCCRVACFSSPLIRIIQKLSIGHYGRSARHGIYIQRKSNISLCSRG